MAEEIKALVKGGKASAGPPLGPQLGPLGVDIKQVISQINDKTKEFEGMEVPVTVKVDDDKNIEIEVGTPPVSALIKNETGAKKLSEENLDIKMDQIIKIAKAKTDGLNTDDVKQGVKQIVGSCVSYEITIEEGDPKEIIKGIDEGKYDKQIGKA